MKTLNFSTISTHAVHLCNNIASFVIHLSLPDNLLFIKHLGEPVIELSEKKIVVVQKVLRDSDGLNFKIKLNSESGRVDLRLRGKSLVQIDKEQALLNFEISIPMLISNLGSSEKSVTAYLS